MSEVKLIKFFGEKCFACNKLTQALNDTEHSFEIEQWDIDTLEGMTKATEYGIMNVPVLIKEKDGEEVDRMIGFNLPDFRRIMK